MMRIEIEELENEIENHSDENLKRMIKFCEATLAHRGKKDGK